MSYVSNGIRRRRQPIRDADADAETTIARVDTDTVVNASTTTVPMRDRGRTVITDRTTSSTGNDGVVEAGFAADDTLTSHTETQYDTQGKLVVAINETRGGRSGTVATHVQTPSGGAYRVVAHDGAERGWTLNPNGTRNEDLPADADSLTHPSETLFGAGMTSMEVAAKNGHLEAGPIARTLQQGFYDELHTHRRPTSTIDGATACTTFWPTHSPRTGSPCPTLR